MLNYCTTALISHASKVMKIILQVRIQQYVNRKPQDVQAGFRKGRGTRDQIANICWIIEKAWEFQKIYFCFIDYDKPLTVHHKKLCKNLQETWISDHFKCLLRNLYASQEATIRTGHGTMDCFKIGKGWWQGFILTSCLFINNVYAEYMMQNAGLNESQAGIKMARRNINSLRYADDTTLMAEIEEELKSFSWGRKRRVKKLT